jgi:small subunit ribosomal protein S21
MAHVIIRTDESLEAALRRFRRKVFLEGVIQDLKRHAFYRSPGEQRREKSTKARKSRAKREMRQAGWEIEYQKRTGGAG